MAIVTCDGVDGKICSSCREWKPVREFSRRQLSPDGFQANCKICSCNRAKRWNDENRDKIREKKRAYAQIHGEKLRAYALEYAAAHREKRRTYIRIYDHANKERKHERRKEYYRNNPD